MAGACQSQSEFTEATFQTRALGGGHQGRSLAKTQSAKISTRIFFRAQQ